MIRIWRLVRNVARRLFYFGWARYCPVCRTYARKFADFGLKRRTDARCLHCGSLERHRLVWLYFQRRTDLFDGKPKHVLHIAPEDCFVHRLREKLGKSYLTADLEDPAVMVQMDITDIRYPDGSFDVIYCSHVLQHVSDDVKAMRELCRVLKPGGWAVLLVPVFLPQTFEDPKITDPAERWRVYGHPDFLRGYGPDYCDRLKSAGFSVSVFRAIDFVDPGDICRMGLSSAAGEIHHCTRNGS